MRATPVGTPPRTCLRRRRACSCKPTWCRPDQTWTSRQPWHGKRAVSEVERVGRLRASVDEQQDAQTPLATPGPSPTPQLVAFAGAMLIEVAVTGALVWSPLAAAVLTILVVNPLREAQQRDRKAQAVREAEERVRVEMAARIPVTPPESAIWMNRMMAEMWVPYVVPMVLGDSLGNLQEKVRRAAPPGWELELVDMNLGRDAPAISNYQAYANPATGRLTAIECDMAFNSRLRVLVAGSGPLGRFSARITGINIKGPMRLIPVFDQRMMLFSFRQTPEMNVKLSVKGPVIGERDIPQFAFINTAVAAALQDCLVEPRRSAISFDYDVLVGQPVDTTFNIFVESVNLGPALQSAAQQQQQPSALSSFDATSSRDGSDAPSNDGSSSSSSTASGSSRVAASPSGGKRKGRPNSNAHIQVSAVNMDNKLERATRPVALAAAPHKQQQQHHSQQHHGHHHHGGDVAVQQMLRLNVGHKDGMFKLTVREVGPGSSAGQQQQSSQPPHVLGSVTLHMAAAKDGSTLFWACQEGGKPVCARWKPSQGPWRVTLPLELPDAGRPPPAAAATAGTTPAAGSSSATGLSADATPASVTGPNPNAALPAGQQQGSGAQLDGAAASGTAQGAAASQQQASTHRGSVTLLLSIDPWVYKHATPASLQAQGLPGQRSLVLQVMEAADLTVGDWAGTCDPYVRLSYDGRTYRSRTVYNTGRPVWQECFVLPDNPSLMARRVTLDVFDSGVSRDERIGSASLNVDMATEYAVQDRWLPLCGFETGSLRVRVVAVPAPPDSEAVKQMVSLFSQPGILLQGASPMLQVVVVAARGLIPRPVGQLMGMRDAYATIRLDGAKQLTPVVKQTQNPRWEYAALFPLSERGEHQQSYGAAGASAAGSSSSRQQEQQAQSHSAASSGVIGSSESGVRGGGGVEGTARHDGTGAAGTAPSAGADASHSAGGSNGTAGLDSAAIATTPSRSHSRGKPKARQLLRIELYDVDPVPPDDELGYVELDVLQVVPQPGDSFEQWLPLKRGEGGEVLVRIAHLAPSPIHQGSVRLTAPALGLASLPAAIGLPTVAASNAGLGAGGQQDPSLVLQPPASEAPQPQLQRVLMDSLAEQIRTANSRATEAGSGFRTKLGQEVIPKVQGWWSNTVQRTTDQLTKEAAPKAVEQVQNWFKMSMVPPWAAGARGAAGTPPAAPNSPRTQTASAPEPSKQSASTGAEAPKPPASAAEGQPTARESRGDAAEISGPGLPTLTVHEVPRSASAAAAQATAEQQQGSLISKAEGMMADAAGQGPPSATGVVGGLIISIPEGADSLAHQSWDDVINPTPSQGSKQAGGRSGAGS